MPTDAVLFFVGPHDHRHGIPPRQAFDAALDFPAAGEERLLVGGNTVDVRGIGREGKLDPALPFETFRFRVLPRLKEPRDGDDGSAAKLLDMNPFRAFNLLKGASRFSLDRLLEGLEAIHETDLALKTSGHPEALLLEQLLVKLCTGT